MMAPGKGSLPKLNPPGKERTFLTGGNLARRLNQAATSYHGHSLSVPESIIRNEIPPKNPINAPVTPVMTSTACNFHPIQAVKQQKTVAATILAKICGLKGVIASPSTSRLSCRT